jgi:hypothetical protein
MSMPTLENFFTQSFSVIKDEWKKLLLTTIFLGLLTSVIGIPLFYAPNVYMPLYFVLSLGLGAVSSILLYTIIGKRLGNKQSASKQELQIAIKQKFWNVLSASVAVMLVIIALYLIIALAIFLILGIFLGQSLITAIMTENFSAIATTSLIPAGIISGLVGLVGVAYIIRFYTELSLVPLAAVIEGKGWFSAVKRSRELIKGNFWPTLGRYFIIGIVNFIIFGFIAAIIGVLTFSAITSPEGVETNFFVDLITNTLATVIFLPVIAAPAVIYFGLSDVKGERKVKSATAKKTTTKKKTTKKSTKKAAKKSSENNA